MKETHNHTQQTQADDVEDWEMFQYFKLGKLEDWRSKVFEAHEFDLMTEDHDKEFLANLPEYNNLPWDLDYDSVWYNHLEMHIYVYQWDWVDLQVCTNPIHCLSMLTNRF